jgi:hypothetical protein
LILDCETILPLKQLIAKFNQLGVNFMKNNLHLSILLLLTVVLLVTPAKAQFNLGKIKDKAKEALTGAKKTASTGASQGSSSGSSERDEQSERGGQSEDGWSYTRSHVVDQIKTAGQEFAASGTVESGILDKTGYSVDDDAFKWFLNLNYSTDAAVQKEAKERLLSYHNLYNLNNEAKTIPANILQEIEAAANDFRTSVNKAGAINKFSEVKASTVNKKANAVKAYLTGQKATVFKIIEKKSWEIEKNEIGIPNYRQKIFVVHYKPAGVGYCVERGAIVRESYAGGGTYESSNPDVLMWSYAKLVGCQ